MRPIETAGLTFTCAVFWGLWWPLIGQIDRYMLSYRARRERDISPRCSCWWGCRRGTEGMERGKKKVDIVRQSIDCAAPRYINLNRHPLVYPLVYIPLFSFHVCVCVLGCECRPLYGRVKPFVTQVYHSCRFVFQWCRLWDLFPWAPNRKVFIDATSTESTVPKSLRLRCWAKGSV